MDQSSHIQIQTRWRFPSLNDSNWTKKLERWKKSTSTVSGRKKAALPFHHNTIQRKILTKEEVKRLDTWLMLLQSTWEELWPVLTYFCYLLAGFSRCWYRYPRGNTSQEGPGWGMEHCYSFPSSLPLDHETGKRSPHCWVWDTGHCTVSVEALCLFNRHV